MNSPSPRVIVLVSSLTIGLGLAACQRHGEHGACCSADAKAVHHEDESETVIQFADLPASVRSALAAITTEASVTKVTREVERGVTSYDIEYTKDGKAWSAEFSASGSMTENELDDGDDDHDDDAHDADHKHAAH